MIRTFPLKLDDNPVRSRSTVGIYEHLSIDLIQSQSYIILRSLGASGNLWL